MTGIMALTYQSILQRFAIIAMINTDFIKLEVLENIETSIIFDSAKVDREYDRACLIDFIFIIDLARQAGPSHWFTPSSTFVQVEEGRC